MMRLIVVADGESHCTDAGRTYRRPSEDSQKLYLQDTKRLYRSSLKHIKREIKIYITCVRARVCECTGWAKTHIILLMYYNFAIVNIQ